MKTYRNKSNRVYEVLSLDVKPGDSVVLSDEELEVYTSTPAGAAIFAEAFELKGGPAVEAPAPEEAPASVEEDDEIDREEVLAALHMLDNLNDDHWTTHGEPRLDAVEALSGEKVTRALVEELAPGLKRHANS